MLKTPLVIMPHSLTQYTNMSYDTYSGNITGDDIDIHQAYFRD